MQLTEDQIDRLFPELSHEYPVYFIDPETAETRSCTFTSGSDPSDVVVEGYPENATPEMETQIFNAFLAAVENDPDDCRLTLASDELRHVDGVKHKTLADRGSLYRLQALTDGWEIEDEAESTAGG